MADVQRLRSFLEVAERGTVAAAAEALGYTAPAVSQHVTKLEREVGASLFDRVGGQLRLAPAGEALIPTAREICDLIDRVPSLVRSAPRRPRLTLAGFASAISTLVVPHLAALNDIATLTVTESEDDGSLRELRLGHVDVALIQEYPGDELHRDARLVYRIAATDELRLIVPPALPTTTTVADLAEQRWLLNGSRTRCAAATRQILAREGVPEVAVSGDVTDNHTLVRLVSEGHGVSIVPSLVLAEAVSPVTVATQRLGVQRTILVVTRQRPDAAIRATVDLLAR